jgi:hypothetical protein
MFGAWKKSLDCYLDFDSAKAHNAYMPVPTSPTSKSKLLPIGILLAVVGMLGKPTLIQIVEAMRPDSLRGILFLIATDGLALLFIAGLTCAFLGWMRNGRIKHPPKNQN